MSNYCTVDHPRQFVSCFYADIERHIQAIVKIFYISSWSQKMHNKILLVFKSVCIKLHIMDHIFVVVYLSKALITKNFVLQTLAFTIAS